MVKRHRYNDGTRETDRYKAADVTPAQPARANLTN